MTEEQIERIAERKMDNLDKALISGRMQQAEYDREVSTLDKWVCTQYRAAGVAEHYCR